jgi:hypothetical protein
MKIRPIEVKLFHADRRRDALTDKYDAVNSRFSQNLCTSPKHSQNLAGLHIWNISTGLYGRTNNAIT